MTEIHITQTEADALCLMEKHRKNDSHWNYPSLGGLLEIPLISVDKRENFILGVSKKGFDLQKCSYQNRAREVVTLYRLDFGKPHRNPDGEEIPSPHIHIYKEGYGDKWAIPIPKDRFPNLNNLYESLFDFMRYCNITKPPFIDEGLFP